MYIERDGESYWLIGDIDKEVAKLHRTTRYESPLPDAIDAVLSIFLWIIPFVGLVIGGIVGSIRDSSFIGWSIVAVITVLSWFILWYVFFREFQRKQQWTDKQQHLRFNYWDERLSAINAAISAESYKHNLQLTLSEVGQGEEKVIIDQFMIETYIHQLVLGQLEPRSFGEPPRKEEEYIKEAAQLAAQEIVQLKLALSL